MLCRLLRQPCNIDIERATSGYQDQEHVGGTVQFLHPFCETSCGVREVGRRHGDEGLEDSTKRKDEVDFDVNPSCTCYE